jgi:signal transduction histidine kinase
MRKKHGIKNGLYLFVFWLLIAPAAAQSDTTMRIQKMYLDNKDTPIPNNTDALTIVERNVRIELYPAQNPMDSFVFSLQDNPIKTALPTIQYTNLSGGSYILKLFLLRGGHQYAPTTWHITVKKRLIEQEWFQIALLLSGLLIVSGFSFLAVQYNYRQKMRDQNMRLQLSADLHEHVGTVLATISGRAKTLKRDLTDVLSVDNNEILNKIIGQSKEAIVKLRQTVWLTDPDNDLMNQLFKRMSSLAKELLPLPCQVDFDKVPNELENMKVSMHQREDVFMMFTEIINNIRKHADATHVAIHIQRHQHSVHLIIKDNGNGFDVEKAFDGFGLKSLRWRAKRSFIQLDIASEMGKGTTVNMIIPEL